MRKKFDVFGKIDFYGTGAKINAVTLEVELREDKHGRPVFSVCGDVWNSKHTDIVCGGQCLDEIAKYKLPHNQDLFDFLYEMWKKYHLNDMHAGTVEQEEAIEKWKAQGNKYDYTKVCEYLKEIGLYEVEYHGLDYNKHDEDGNYIPYRYGSAWLYREIDADDLERIKSILSE